MTTTDVVHAIWECKDAGNLLEAVRILKNYGEECRAAGGEAQCGDH